MVQNNTSNGLKVALIGDGGVGKSSILSILQGEVFSACYVQTKDRIIKSHDIVLQNGRRQSLQIWDTAGSDDFRTYTAHSIKDVKGVIIVFDVCNETSYMNVQNWIKTLNHYVENAADSVVIIIAANKIDKESRYRKVKPEQVQQLAHQHNVQCIEVSAKTGERIQELFDLLASALAERATRQEEAPRAGEDEEVSEPDDGGFLSSCVLL
ncbi:ras-related protein Rab-13-like [Actinia tenebrosa]|uniref:Ras-related protein Rab-13-like n=1 Tax=Actinia tenebrosa TaxID=6105 RepID=A0A6P8I2S5_ACTTE|nr:ras-related protein Rab-13-like [Actinia tenebrosa]